jgi:aminoglycoside phosphotransferase family enzyme/predicted kinase
VHWLQDPATWSQNRAETNDAAELHSTTQEFVECVETHISQVFLVGSRVCKLKKPVKYDFLDFSTLAAREHACREEVRLNRRLAPQIYLGVRPITQGDHKGFQLDGNGPVVDWLVEMQRLPADRMLDVLHANHAVTEADVDRIASLLTSFYKSLPPVELTPEAYRDLCLNHVRGNFAELISPGHQLDRWTVVRTQAFQLQLLHLHRSLFDQRVRDGKIIEGHGDLRPEHICLIDPIAIFDCIEFSQQFRQLDRVDELAFLVSECQFIDAAWIGVRLRDQYQAISGDRVPDILFNFYKTYRASVRAKVAALRANQLEEDGKRLALEEAALHLKHADEFCASHCQPLMLIVGGLSGTGKTTLARHVAEELGAELLRSDVVRQTLFESQNNAADRSPDKYSRKGRDSVYAEMNRQAADLLRQGVSVVLDATFSSSASVAEAHSLASTQAQHHSGFRRPVFFAIECCCDAEIAKKRIACRLQTEQDASEATPELHDQQRRQWQEWPHEIDQCRVNTEQSLDEQFETVKRALIPLVEMSLRADVPSAN